MNHRGDEPAAPGRGGKGGPHVSPSEITRRALDRAPAEGRNEAGLWLACQLRDNGVSEGEARGEMEAFARSVPQPDGKGRYTEAQALSTLASVYRRPAREPWGSGTDGGDHRPPRAAYDLAALPAVDPSAFPADATGLDFEAARLLQMGDPRVRAAHARAIEREAARIAADASRESLDLEDAPFLPEALFEGVAAPLRDLVGAYDQRYERDVFLIASIPLIGAMLPNVWTRQGRRYVAPTSYVVVTAEAGHGKGVLSDAQKVGAPLDHLLAERREREKRAWKADKKDAAALGFNEPPEPPDYRLFIPANSSATPFFRALKGNGGRGCVYETEIRGLVNATRQDWGDYTEGLLKAWPHERLSLLRANEEFRIDNPVLSVAISGTPDQVVQLLPSTEDGLFSRFGVYHFVGEDGWIDQGPTSAFDTFHDGVAALGVTLADAYETLWARDGQTLYVDVPKGEWDRIQAPFAGLKAGLIARGERRLLATAHRASVNAARMAVALTMLEHVCAGRPVGVGVRSVDVSPAAVDVALWVAWTLADHAVRLAQHLPKGQTLKGGYSRKVLEALARALPERFDRAALLGAASALGLKQSQAYEYRARLLQHKLAEPDGYGWCKKTPACPQGTDGDPDANAGDGVASGAPSLSTGLPDGEHES